MYTVARCVHFLQLHLVGKKIAKVTAIDDSNVFGKAGTSASEFEEAIKGKRVVSAGRQGKYFWYGAIQTMNAARLRTHLTLSGSLLIDPLMR